MNDIVKFFVFTRGRTGSTAIIDEINKHPGVGCWQEPFILLSSDSIMERFYERHGARFEDYEIVMEWRPSYDLWTRQFVKYRIFNRIFYIKDRWPVTSAQMVRLYLEYLIKADMDKGRQASGFKLLQNQADNAPGLIGVLKDTNYRVIYLERVNVIKQVISGLIAKKRRKYNALNYKPPGDAYLVDLDELESLVRWELDCVKREKQMLEDQKFDTLHVTYEDFLQDREKFYSGIFEFLEVDNILPKVTDYSIMIPSIEEVVQNYDELYQRVEQMGYSGMLD